jgi:hypothetical protein
MEFVEGGRAMEATISGVKLWSTVSECASSGSMTEGAGWDRDPPKISRTPIIFRELEMEDVF